MKFRIGVGIALDIILLTLIPCRSKGCLVGTFGRLMAIVVFLLASRFRGFYISWDVLGTLAQDFLISGNLTLFIDLSSCLVFIKSYRTVQNATTLHWNSQWIYRSYSHDWTRYLPQLHYTNFKKKKKSPNPAKQQEPSPHAIKFHVSWVGSLLAVLPLSSGIWWL